MGLSGNKADASDIVASTRNWYSERYENVLVQRNILLAMTVLAILVMVAAVIAVSQVASSKTVDPFIVEVEDKSGIATVVNPTSRIDLTTNEALNQYFVVTYVRARESYNSADFQYNMYTLARLFSSSKVWNDLRQFVANNDPTKLYADNVKFDFVLKSIQILSGNQAQVRFKLIQRGGDGRESHRITTLKFEYQPSNFSLDERLVNPLGFFVTDYSSSIDAP